MSDNNSHAYDLIDQLAEEFAGRFRKGERPSIQEYCERYPHIADDLRHILPALAEVEQVKGGVDDTSKVEPPKLRQVGEYSILREVGRGGMGIVYEAEQVSLGRRVALKVLAGGKSGHGLERFKREARAAARLHHTNIVPVFGVGDHEGLPYYVMQFILGLGLDEVLEEVKRLQALSGAPVPPSGLSATPARQDISAAAVARSLVTGTFAPASEENLAETLTQAGSDVGQVSNLSEQSGQVGNLSHSSISLPGQTSSSGRKPSYWQSVAQIGLQVADALEYAHKQGVLHRDIKPSNLLLDLHGVVWVTDFGLAKADDQENLTHTGDMLGTLRYMPPEAFEGKNDVRSDVYSLGLSIYELLALRPAHDERKREQLIKQVTTFDPPRLGSLNKSIPRDLQTIVHKAIEKNPDHRYKSAGDLAADLRRYLSDQSILARRVKPVERFARWCRRNPTVAALSGAVAILLLAGTTISTFLAIEARHQAGEALREKERADANLYVARMNLVQTDWENNNLGRVLESLNFYGELASQKDLRGFEWHYWQKRCHAEESGWKAHRGIAWDLTYSPDGKWLASTGYGEVKLWEAQTGAEIHAWKYDRGDVPKVAFSPDSRRLAAIDHDRTLRIWDTASREELLKLISPEKSQASTDLAFSPDGVHLVVVESGGDLRILNAQNGQVVNMIQVNAVLRCVAVSPDRKLIAAGTAFGKVLLWDRTTGQQTATFNSHPTEIRCVAFNNDGRELASTGIDGSVKIWANVPAARGEVKEPKFVLQGHSAPVFQFAFSPDGKYLASASQDRLVNIWDTGAGKLIRNFKGHANTVTSVTFHPKGQRIASADGDGLVKIWSLTPEAWPRVVSHPAAVHHVAFSQNGKYLASVTAPDGPHNARRTSNQVIRVMDAGSGQTVKTIKSSMNEFNVVALSPDGARLAAGFGRPPGQSDEIRIWSTTTNEEPLVLTGFAGEVARLEFSDDGLQLYSASINEVNVWDSLNGNRLNTMTIREGNDRNVAFSRDGKQAALADVDGVEVWDLATQRMTRSVKALWGRYGTGLVEGGRGPFAFSSDGEHAAAPDHAGRIWLWTLASDREPFELKGHTGSILGLAFTPDGKRLASTSRDRLIKLWDTESGQEVLVLKDHTDGVACIAFSSDGLQLASAGMDKTVRIWDARPSPHVRGAD